MLYNIVFKVISAIVCTVMIRFDPLMSAGPESTEGALLSPEASG